MTTLHVICIAYNKPIHLRLLIDSFILQTCPNWKLHIVHDGPSIPAILHIITLYNDQRIEFMATSERRGNHGYPQR